MSPRIRDNVVTSKTSRSLYRELGMLARNRSSRSQNTDPANGDTKASIPRPVQPKRRMDCGRLYQRRQVAQRSDRRATGSASRPSGSTLLLRAQRIVPKANSASAIEIIIRGPILFFPCVWWGFGGGNAQAGNLRARTARTKMAPYVKAAAAVSPCIRSKIPFSRDGFRVLNPMKTASAASPETPTATRTRRKVRPCTGNIGEQMETLDIGLPLRRGVGFDESAAQTGVARSRDRAGNVLEQLMTQTGGFVQTIWRKDPRDHREMARPNQGLQPNRVVLKRPCQAHAVRGFGQTVPSKRSDPASVDALDKST